MAINSTLLTLLQELMSEYDSTVDTSEGSAFYNQVASPLLTRIGDDPASVDLETFFVDRLRTEVEGIDTSRFSGVRNLLIQAELPMFEPFRRELNAIKTTASLSNYEMMTRAELDDRLGNLLTSLDEGNVATGVVRVGFTSPRSVSVGPLNQFSTQGGLNFFPSTVQAITAEGMSFQFTEGLYYVDFFVEAESAGEEYNVLAEDISIAQNIPGAVRVWNPLDFDDGAQADSKADGFAKAQEAVTLRTFATSRGSSFLVKDLFSSINTVQVVGAGDPEMLRDLLVGPVSVGDVPGGIGGESSLSVAEGNSVHLGNMSDIYVYQRAIGTTSLDIQNITDKGIRVYAGSSGRTPIGGGSSFSDARGFFVSRGVEGGNSHSLGDEFEYWLLLDGDAFYISTVSETQLTVLDGVGGSPAALPASLTGLTYEIVKRQRRLLSIPLYDLVAMVGGEAVFDGAGDPVAPVPGSLESLGVAKTENIAEANIQLPLLRVSSVEELDSVDFEVTGTIIPMRDVLGAKVLSGFAEDSDATGKTRLYFKDPVNMAIIPEGWGGVDPARSGDVSRLTTEGGRTYTRSTTTLNLVAEGAHATVSGSPTSVVTLAVGTYTGGAAALASALSPGDRLLINDTTNGARLWVSIISAAVSGSNVDVTVREEFSDDFAAQDAYHAEGITQSAMLSQGKDTNGLYFYDNRYDWEADVVVDVAPSVGSLITDVAILSEGWSLKTTNGNLSYSTRELPYLQFTEWVADTLEVGDVTNNFTFRANYEYAATLAAIQALVESDDYRVASGDPLIRHFLPTYVFTSMVVTGITAAVATPVVLDFIRDLDPTAELVASVLACELEDAGATKVQLPFTLTGARQDSNRAWTLIESQDSLDTERTEHFLPDTGSISITQA